MDNTEKNQELWTAISDKDQEAVRVALAHGADPNAPLDPSGNSALYWAAFGGSREVAKLLIKAGAKVERDSEADTTALHAAVENGDLSMVEVLLEADGNTALDRYDYIDRTPLIIAAGQKKHEIARRLIAS